MANRIAFIMDPLASIKPEKDSTLVLMEEAGNRGFEVNFIHDLEVMMVTDRVLAPSQKVVACRHPFSIETSPTTMVDVSDFDVIFIRKDPPVDDQYVRLLQMLGPISEKTLILNSPAGIMMSNEKLATLAFKQFTPKSAVGSTAKNLFSYVADFGKKLVVKPLNLFGGEGVQFCDNELDSLESAMGNIQSGGNDQVIVQEFIENVVLGDKRIIVIGGVISGAVLRVPAKGSFVANFHAGGTSRETVVTEKEREIVAGLKPYLLENGLYLVGLDVIDGRLTEINVTSPTGFQEIEKHSGVNPAKEMFNIVEDLSAKRKEG